MKAIVQNGYGSADKLELREVDRPAVTDDTVLVRIRAASINAADYHMMRRVAHVVARLLRQPVPRIRGIDLAGIVEACGRNVTRFKPGDEVFGVARGTCAEFAAISEAYLTPKPTTLSFEQAAAIPVAGCTAIQAVRDHARIQPGQRVLVYGAGGGTGTFTVQVAKAFGAHVTAVTRTGSLDLLRSIGADQVVDHTKEDFTRRDGRYDAVFDIGADRTLEDVERTLAPNGSVVLIGAPKKMWALLTRLAQTKRKGRGGTRRITFMARAKQEDLRALGDLAEAGRLVPVIDRVFDLSEAPEAFRHFGSGGVRGKVVIRIA